MIMAQVSMLQPEWGHFVTKMIGITKYLDMLLQHVWGHVVTKMIGITNSIPIHDIAA